MKAEDIINRREGIASMQVQIKEDIKGSSQKTETSVR